MKKPFNLPFVQFAETAKPSGAANRLPSMGVGSDMFSYSVYMNGQVSKELPSEVQEFHFKDVMLHALTEKLGLNPESFRDNLKVAELVATRNAWLAAIVVSKDRAFDLSDEILDDYTMLTKGMSHPWIVQELNKQRALSSGLQPVLDSASQITGTKVSDRSPSEITVGMVVSQNTDFTTQATANGEVVTHENRRLESVPEVGQTATVVYYRGNGQVFDSRENLKVSAPFVDKESGDLAVSLIDASGKAKQVVLFNGITTFAKFVTAQGLDMSLVEEAVEVRVATPKIFAKEATVRELVSDVYIDQKSGCLAVDFKENGNQYSAIFGSASTLADNRQEYGLDSASVERAKALEASRTQHVIKNENESLNDLVEKLAGMGINQIADAAIEGRLYAGRAICESSLHLAQDMGRGVVMLHDKRDLDKLPAIGDSLTVKYQNGAALVSGIVKAQSKSIER